MDIERPRAVGGPRQRRNLVPDGPRPITAPRLPASESTSRRRGGWEPLSGDALLQRLRITGRPRPAARPELTRTLWGLLESELARSLSGRAAEDPVGASVSHGSPLQLPVLVTKDRLTRVLACEAHQAPTGSEATAFSSALACGSLIDVLFRQLVTVGSIGDPMEDGLAALEVDARRSDLWAWIESLAGPERDELRAEVERQADGLCRRWPVLDPVWLPRTQESLRARSDGGAVELSARVDLVIGRPARDEGSVAIVEVKSGSRRVEHRSDLHFYALLEALRSPAPPFVVATYYSRTGELDVDPVTDELLVSAARRTAVGSRLLVDQAHGIEPDRRSGPLCGHCSIVPDAIETGLAAAG
jgi:hypothetical protein